ncbi:hypothetical protein [Actinospongicola halichondriae]|uniref:hypothetical protein n=1 Tax=Actinospongicola halichondriae TaxID=3236844 RepID=UPI003D37C134
MPGIDVQPDTIFDPIITRKATAGAVLGLLGIVVIFALGVLITDGDPAVIGAAGLVAPFGGAGFGAMMGAVLGAIESNEQEERDEREARDG